MLVVELEAGLVVRFVPVVDLLVQVVVLGFVRVDLTEKLLEAVSFARGELLGLQLVAEWKLVVGLTSLVGLKEVRVVLEKH